MFKAFVGYYQGNGHMIIDQTQIFDTEQEAENWIEFMLNMDSQYDVAEIKEILRTWIKTTSGYDVMEDKDTFEIYIKIAKECFDAVPIKVIKHKLFQQFKITKKQKPNNTYVYYYK